MVDLKRVEAARKLLGEFPLAVDANQQWDRPTMIAAKVPECASW
jgi:L-talarate/galactarate dehydratase